MDSIKVLMYTIPAILVAISMHEFAHGYMSHRLGDPTPQENGRLSLNPLKHLDPMGTLCLLILQFGWAKPVRVNPQYYKNKKQGMVLVALAGPVMNFCVAFFSILLWGIIIKITGGYVGPIMTFISILLHYSSIINIGLGVFNLIPVPPLDGSKVLGAILPEKTYFHYMQYERYGSIILIVLLFSNVLNGPLKILRAGLTNGMWIIVSSILNLT